MTMPKKGSRGITVDGVSYRFMVRDEGDNQETLRVTIEPEAHPGHVCVARYGRHLLDPIGQPQVEQIIRYARGQGWAPASMSNYVMGDQAIKDMLKAQT